MWDDGTLVAHSCFQNLSHNMTTPAKSKPNKSELAQFWIWICWNCLVRAGSGDLKIGLNEEMGAEKFFLLSKS